MSASESAFIRGMRVGLRGVRRQARAHSRVLTALAIVSLVLLGVFVAALPISASAGPSSVATTAPAAHAVHAAGVVQASTPGGGGSGASACGSSLNGSTLFCDIWNMLSLIFTPVLTALGDAFSTILGAFADGIGTMFTQWGNSFYGFGIWAPLMVVISLGVAAFVGYYFMDMEGVEGDIGKLIGMASGEGEEEPEVP